MKIALAQINTTVGDIAGNRERALSVYEQAKSQGADLVVFPELTTTGYPPKDLLDHRSFIDANLESVEQFALATAGEGNPGMILGYVERHDAEGGKELFNAAALIDGGKIISSHQKSLLPTYDVFDETRHFQPAHEISTAVFRGTRIAITICEDFWNDRLYWRRRAYLIDPIEKLAGENPDLMITIAASPYAVGKPSIRAGMYSLATARYGVPLIHVNQVGGNDSLIFDGRSNAWGADGRIVAQAKSFEEDLVLVDIEKETAGTKATSSLPPSEEEANEDIYGALRLGVRDYVAKCGFSQVAIALSGGIDSALTAVLAVDALGPEAVMGVAMPSEFSSDHSVSDAEQLAQNLGIDFHVLPIRTLYDDYMESLKPIFKDSPFGVAEENIQARIRGNLMMAISNKFGWLVLTTGNKSELAVGYCTLYGDMCGGLAVLSDLLKTRVFSLSRWINRTEERIPVSTIEKPPSAELRPGQLDSDSLPDYADLDPIVEAYIERHEHSREIIAAGADEATVKRVIQMIDRNEYKRQQLPIGLKVTDKAFGIGRRMPIARGEW